MDLRAKRNPSISYASVAAKDLRNVRFSPTGQAKQYFAIPFTIIKYILNHPLSAKVLQKLHKTCKYFYANFPVYIFPRARYENGFFWKWDNLEIMDIKNPKTKWWFQKELLLTKPFGTLVKRIFRCEISFLCIAKTVLRLTEFEFLTSANTITDFCLQGKIINASGRNVEIDVILSKLPNLQKLWYYNYDEKYSNSTLKNLCSLKFNNELCKFVFCADYLEPYCDPYLFIQFFQQHFALKSEINIYFVNDDSEIFQAEFKGYVDQWLSSFPTNNKPLVLIERKKLN